MPPSLGSLIIAVWVIATVLLVGLALRLSGVLRLAIFVFAATGLLAPSFLFTQERTRLNEATAQKQAALSYFEEKCKSSGYFKFQDVAPVRGLELLRVRQTSSSIGQFTKADPYGRDEVGEEFIATFLRTYVPGYGLFESEFDESAQPGFSFVDTTDESGNRVRYTGAYEELARQGSANKRNSNFKLAHQLTQEPRAKYGMTYDDISTDEDLQHWVAGSSLRIIDLNTGNVVAERLGYTLDPMFGHTTNPWGRSPLLACPSFRRLGQEATSAFSSQVGQARRFADFVLRRLDNITNYFQK